MRPGAGIIVGMVGSVLMLAALELASRAYELVADTEPSLPAELELDMPRWLVEARTNPERVRREDVRWFENFESGPGFRVRLLPERQFFIDDTFSWGRHLPGSGFSVVSNRLGFRGNWHFPSKNQFHSESIAIFGDSSSFGWGVSEGEYFADLLSEANENKKVLNFAMPGDSSEFGRLIIERYLPQLDAQKVIFSFGANDARRSSVPHQALVQSFEEVSGLIALRQQLSSHSAFFRVFESVLDDSPEPSAVVVNENRHQRAVALKEYRSNLVGFAQLAFASGASDVTFLALCSPGPYRRAMERAATRSGARFVDGVALLQDALPQLEGGEIFDEEVGAIRERFGVRRVAEQPLLLVSTDGCHPNELGHRIIAQALHRVWQDDLPS